jgi:predicted DNA-binding antitoxin AbrB/MazE fold protein
MTIAAKYEDGVFKPPEDVKLTGGTTVEVHIPGEGPRRPKSVREFAAFGMWADREDIPDGVTYEDRMRQPLLLKSRSGGVPR